MKIIEKLIPNKPSSTNGLSCPAKLSAASKAVLGEIRRQNLHSASPRLPAPKRMWNWGTILSLLIASVSAVFAYHSYRVSDMQRVIMEKGLEESRLMTKETQRMTEATVQMAKYSQTQTELSKDSVEAAKLSAIAADRSVSVAQKSFALSSRPYVAIKSISIEEVLPIKPIIGMIEVENTGQTPALNTEVIWQMSLYHGPVYGANLGDYLNQVKPDVKKAGLVQSKVLLASGQSLKSWSERMNGLAPDAAIAVENGQMTIFAHGIVKYSDGLSSNHSTKFCYYYNYRLKQFTGCNSYNEMK